MMTLTELRQERDNAIKVVEFQRELYGDALVARVRKDNGKLLVVKD